MLTLGITSKAEFVCFATQVEHLADHRRRFTLTPDEFGLINPNTRTCPVFRSERDAELTKKLYRAAPVLIEEAVTDEEGRPVRSEVNPWGISFSQGLFNMTSDSGLFADSPASALQPVRLPLYEAKMIHQFDHRWATYVDAPGGAVGEVETADVRDAQKADPTFTVRPRYWVDEREVLVRIARVPIRVARAWLALHAAQATGEREAEDAAQADLMRALAQWLTGELFLRSAGKPLSATGWKAEQALPHIAPVEAELSTKFARLGDVLRSEGVTTKKAVTEFPKWALQSADARLDDDDLAALTESLRANTLAASLCTLLDGWMDERSPQWLMGWRDICRSTDERTVIASVVPRAGVGNKIPLFFPRSDIAASQLAALLGNLSALTLDFVARQKIGGTTLNYFYMKQFPVLAPDRYTAADLDFIVPRVLELTYTAHDLKPWADDLAAYDPRTAAERERPFAWDPDRRAHLRADLDAHYARLYGLTRDELRYILDPKDVMGADYPSETFRVLKEGELRTFGQYRTRRQVLEAWDALNAASTQSSQSSGAASVQYSPLGMIRTAEEGRLAGLVAAVLEVRAGGFTVSELQSLLARAATDGLHLVAADSHRLSQLVRTAQLPLVSPLLDRVRPIVERLEAAGSAVRQAASGEDRYVRGTGALPAEVVQDSQYVDLASLLVSAEERRIAAEGILNAAPESQSKTGTK